VFDASIDRYNVYKVETIGDAYLVASGLPSVYDRHAQEMSLLALELLDSVKQHIIPHLPQKTIQLRIGLHSGWSTFTVHFNDRFPGRATGRLRVYVCVRTIATKKRHR